METDPRIDVLITDVADLKRQMAENTAITTQVRDVLASFRTIAAVAKWVSVVAAACVAVYHGITALWGHN